MVHQSHCGLPCNGNRFLALQGQASYRDRGALAETLDGDISASNQPLRRSTAVF